MCTRSRNSDPPTGKFSAEFLFVGGIHKWHCLLEYFRSSFFKSKFPFEISAIFSKHRKSLSNIKIEFTSPARINPFSVFHEMLNFILPCAVNATTKNTTQIFKHFFRISIMRYRKGNKRRQKMFKMWKRCVAASVLIVYHYVGTDENLNVFKQIFDADDSI